MKNNKSNMEVLEKHFSEIGVKFEKDASLKELTTLGVGGTAKFLAEPASIPELLTILKLLKERDIQYRVLGIGSNVLAQDKGYDGVILRLNDEFNKFDLGSSSVVFAGVNLLKLCYETSANGYSGIENLAGIPGTVGGAIFGNAGARGTEISDAIESVCVLDENLETKTLTKTECNFGYRDSIFKHKNHVILSAKLKLEKVEKEKSIAQFNEAIKNRKTNGLEGKNAGSVFKNPKGDFAGRLIEEAGFKGYETENVIVSKNHSNIICVKNNLATSEEILEIISKIRKEVYNMFRIELETEIQIL